MAETTLAEVLTQLVSILAPQGGPTLIDFLLVLSVMMVNVIAFKFIASINFGLLVHQRITTSS